MGDIERGFPSQFQLFLQHNDAFHLSDVQSVGDNMANEILAKLFGTSVPRARLVFSSTIIPEQWSKGTPKEALFGVSTKRGGGDSQAAAVTHPTHNGPVATVEDRSRDADVAVGRSAACARGR